MGHISKLLFTILAVQSLVLLQVNAADVCTGLLTESSCKNNSSCNWGKSNNFACSYKTNCASQTTDPTCTNADTNSSCKWVPHEGPVCTLKADTCQLTGDKSACNYPKSCNYTDLKPATCTVAGGTFGCKNNASAETCNQAYCDWDYSCVSTDQCTGLSKVDCNLKGQGDDFCDYVPTSCIINPNASRTCTALKAQDKCLAANCLWAAAKCTAPTDPNVCNIVTPEGGIPECGINNDNICQMNNGTCQTKATSPCGSQTSAQCTDAAVTFGFCKVGVQQCNDKANYCNVATCETQAPQCSYTKQQDATCTNNTQTNECTPQTSQAECVGIEYCSFSDDAQCDQTQTCPLFSQTVCTGNQSCSWDSVYTCTQTIIPNSSSSSILGVGLATLCAATLLA